MAAFGDDAICPFEVFKELSDGNRVVGEGFVFFLKRLFDKRPDAFVVVILYDCDLFELIKAASEISFQFLLKRFLTYGLVHQIGVPRCLLVPLPVKR